MKNENLQQLLKEGKITSKTLEKVIIAKSYIEKKYSIKKVKEEEKKKEWETFNKKMDELKLSAKEKDLIKKDVIRKEAEYLRLGRKKITIREFEPVGIIGRGAFGEVRVCRHVETSDIVAIKKMRKEDMVSKNQIMHVRTEKEILTNAKNPWIVNLRYSFQDDYYLYLVMDFLPGGDLMSLLMKKDILTENEARFYTAEMILAVESVHNLKCIHRDLKPDNVLIDKNGHIQLSDFGLSKLSDQTFFPMSSELKSEVTSDENTTAYKSGAGITDNKLTRQEMKTKRKNRLIAFSTVGTPDYIAPEVFGQNGYGQEVDWWSVGVILFEMLVGYPPFFSENPSETCQKIVKWKQYFSIPLDANLSLEAENLIRKMVNVPEQRLGIGGAEEIKKHPFFKSIDWENLRSTTAPFIPDIQSDWDTKYFDTFPEQEPFYPQEKKIKKRKDINYAGYTYNRDMENQRGGLLHALEVLETVKQSTQDIDEKYKIVDDIENDRKDGSSKDVVVNNEEMPPGDGEAKSGRSSGTQQPILSQDTVTITSNTNQSGVNSNAQEPVTSSEVKAPASSNLTTSKISTSSGKGGVNIIPIKSLASHREGRVAIDVSIKSSGASPKLKEMKIALDNQSPKQKLAPLSGRTKNNAPNIGINDPNKNVNKIYTTNSSQGNKSSSPKHMDTPGGRKLK